MLLRTIGKVWRYGIVLQTVVRVCLLSVVKYIMVYGVGHRTDP